MSALTALLSFSLLATAALGDELAANPTNLGIRSNNPEQETYATADTDTVSRTLAFIGPARRFGPVTGNPEKDTIAYSPLFVHPEETQASLNTRD